MKKIVPYIMIVLVTALFTGALVAFLLNIRTRMEEGRPRPIQVVDLTEETTDPAIWGQNFPREYDGYKKTELKTSTRYGGSEGISKLTSDPKLKIIFAGYAFSVDYNPRRGHYYSLQDQKETLRTKNYKQMGSCLQCHAGGLKNIYEKVGNGDVMAGFEKVCSMPLKDAWQYAQHPVACVDCHDPKTMNLRVTRPAFLKAIKKLKEKEGMKDYDPNETASRQEMRTYVCAQCHVEYYCGPKATLFYPWDNGLKVEEIEAFYNNYKFKDGHRFYDFKHEITGAEVLKAQHPEFEMWSQGVHSKSGVACADCHMPYMREGATKVTDHYVRSPLLNVSRSCLQCHHFTEKEMLERVESIQNKNRALLDRSETALVALIDKLALAKKRGVPEAELAPAYEMQRTAQWRADFINAENSMGFHAPQEAARILAESIDYARQGELIVQVLLEKYPASSAVAGGGDASVLK
ncbi:MAG: ammonia-forming cytochrome c nitrite reductase subunit c552 [Candidatus Omnitrophica bacterium]|nr:ammonia-forming cytochrome c nitrite reductase subunit c552 [Candidatus Omnitrophota bacterium]